MDLYAENILDHYRHPRQKQRLANPTISREEVNHSCGDALMIDLVMKDGRITEIGWTGTGCAISQAAMSMLTEELEGKTVEVVQALKPQDIYDLLGVPVSSRRMKCALLGLFTLKNALRTLSGDLLLNWNDLTA